MFIVICDQRRYNKIPGNLTPADVYFGRGQTILLKREGIKRTTFEQQRSQFEKLAAYIIPSDDPDLPLSKNRDVLEVQMLDTCPSSQPGYQLVASSFEQRG